MARAPTNGTDGLEMAARLGFAARAVTYAAIGYLTLRLGRTEDNQGVLTFVQSAGGGILLALMALGFAGYGLWRLSEAAVDSEGQGSDARGTVQRLGGAASGMVHLFLCWAAVRLLVWGEQGGGNAAEQGASTALRFPGGRVALIVAAMVLLGLAAYQIVKAVKLGFLKHLDPAAAQRPWVGWVGRAGYLARGIVFAATALFMWQASETSRASEAGGLEQALDSFPAWLRIIVAAGLFLFGVFSAVEARYRRITDTQVMARLKEAGGRLTD
jgi:hypothetical protein